MQERNEPGTTTRDPGAPRGRRRGAPGAPPPLPAPYARYLLAVEALVGEVLTEDAVEDRLRRLLAEAPPAIGAPPFPPPTAAATDAPAAPVPRAARNSRNDDAARAAPYDDDTEAGFESRMSWAAFGHGVVSVWLRTVRAAAPRLLPGGDDIEEMARETTARALNSFRDEAGAADRTPAAGAGRETREAFLAQCVRHLPHVHRSERLKAGHPLVDDPLEAEDEAGELIEVLWHCVTDHRAETLRLVTGGHHLEAVVELTPGAICTAVRRYPGLIGRVPPS
ncbi:hypothetical protein [Streptomyces sp. URMC 123]|uniref:hypothetical protein n=1 Tax=Streptomyces sp. URMC 123 TaxID=3423403 RepID=UPI003F1C674B